MIVSNMRRPLSSRKVEVLGSSGEAVGVIDMKALAFGGLEGHSV